MKHLLLAFFLLCVGHVLVAQASFSTGYEAPSTNQEVELRVFPNPAVNHIEVNDNTVVRQVSIFNLVGRKVKQFSYAQGEKFFVGDLPRGMYLVQLIGDRNAVLTTRRINIR